MSALLDQFVEEAGDLLASAGSALLLLERNPSDADAVNDLFRSVHTLKGTSALFEFPALTKLVHAGEDLLDLVREGKVPVSSDLVDVQLELLDLLRSWLESIRSDGRLPESGAEVSRSIVARLVALKQPGAELGDAGPPALESAARPALVDCSWGAALPEPDRLAAFAAWRADRLSVWAVEYTPDSDCYFRGEDPFQTCRGVPDLVALSVETVKPEPPLAEFDPYVCRLRFNLLTTAPKAELDHLFRYVDEQVRIVEIAPERLAVPQGTAASDPAAAEFAGAAAGWLTAGALPALRDAATALLAVLEPASRSASALRWLQAFLDMPEPQLDWLAKMIAAVGGAPLDWNDSAAEPLTPVIAHSEIVDRIVEQQRTILDLPSDDPAVLAARLVSVGRVLTNLAVAHAADVVALRLQEATAAALRGADPQPLRNALEASFVGAVPPAGALGRTAAPSAPAGKPDGSRPDGGDHHIKTLKVDQAKIDRLMALIGELVVAKNALPFLARRAENVFGSRELGREIGQRYSVIDRLAQEMQEAIMEVRLLPVSEVFARFPRLVRDIARKLDKQIDLVLEGEETQADKNIIELLGDPLIHIVRNAADHGIETPQVRIENGKPPQGTIRLKAMQEGDQVVIEVSDDGRGVDTARVIAKALERGIIDPEEAERMTPSEAAQLIFHPGLSTADAISDLSGRGVGMDVVQTAIRDASGSVAVSSQPGAGTTVRLALPLSMAVMRVMTIETAGALYGVPIDVIAETVRIDTTAIREIKMSEAFLLRDTIVPLIRLRRLLHLPNRAEEREAVLVLRTPGGPVGMIVDRFDEHMDIILKPLEGILVGLRGFAGTALLGDGRVLMVLNTKELLSCL